MSTRNAAVDRLHALEQPSFAHAVTCHHIPVLFTASTTREVRAVMPMRHVLQCVPSEEAQVHEPRCISNARRGDAVLILLHRLQMMLQVHRVGGMQCRDCRREGEELAARRGECRAARCFATLAGRQL